MKNTDQNSLEARLLSRLEGFADPSEAFSTVFIRSEETPMRGAIAHHEKTHSFLLQTTAVGIATKILATLSSFSGQGLRLLQKSREALDQVLNSQIRTQEMCATYRQYIYICGQYPTHLNRFEESISGTLYESVLEEAKSLVSENSLKSADIEDVFICIAQAALNNRILFEIPENASIEEVVDALGNSSSVTADSRLKTLIDAISEDDGASFNSMMYENTPRLGRQIIDLTPNNSPMASSSILRDNEIVSKVDFSDVTSVREGQKLLRVAPYQIFKWIEENAFPVELKIPEYLNELISKTSGLEWMTIRAATDGEAPHPNPEVKYKVKSDRKNEIAVINQGDLGKTLDFLDRHLRNVSLTYVLPMNVLGEDSSLILWPVREPGGNSDFAFPVMLQNLGEKLLAIIHSLPRQVIFISIGLESITQEFLGATNHQPKVISWAGSLPSDFSKKFPGELKQFATKDHNRDLMTWIRTTESKSVIFTGFLDSIEYQMNVGSFDDGKSLFQSINFSQSEISNFYSLVLENGNVFDALLDVAVPRRE